MPPLTLFAYRFTSMDHNNDNSYYTVINYFVNIQKMGIVCFAPYFEQPFSPIKQKRCLVLPDILSRMGLSGLEPPTSRLSGVRSNRLSYKPLCKARCVYYNIFHHSSSGFPIIL